MFFASIIAAGLGLLLALVWRFTRRSAAMTLAFLWLVYAGYEFLMFRRVLCTG
jgi:hypothetical protein